MAISHDINLALQYCDESLLLGPDNSYYFGKTNEVFSSGQIERVFGVRTFEGKIGEKKFFIPLGEGFSGNNT